MKWKLNLELCEGVDVTSLFELVQSVTKGKICNVELSSVEELQIPTSREKEAEYYNQKTKKRQFSLDESEKELLQSMMDNRCQEITERYFAEIRKCEQKFIDDVKRIKDISLQYPVFGSAPHERLFLLSCDQSFRRHRDEMRRLKGICDTLGLKTNHLLDRVLGCSVLKRKCEPQGAQHLL